MKFSLFLLLILFFREIYFHCFSGDWRTHWFKDCKYPVNLKEKVDFFIPDPPYGVLPIERDQLGEVSFFFLFLFLIKKLSNFLNSHF